MIGSVVRLKSVIRPNTATSTWEELAWPGVVYILSQLEDAPDLADHLRVPARLGLQTGGEEHHYGDLFQRALLADVLSDCTRLCGDHLRPVVNREIDYLLSRARSDGRGWNYFPTLPEFPPDADTLSAITITLATADRLEEARRRCVPALDFALHNCTAPNGIVRTWLLSPDERTAGGGLPEPWSVCMWDGDGDADVVPSFLYALHLVDPNRYESRITEGIDHLEQVQRSDGGWTSPFYCGRFFAVFVCLRLLAATRPDSPALGRALDLLRNTQRPDGGWGSKSLGSDPLSTSFALLGLATSPGGTSPDDLERAIRGAEYLRNTRSADRLWPACPFYWILDEIGKPPAMTPFLSRTVTCAVVVKAALAWRELAEDGPT